MRSTLVQAEVAGVLKGGPRAYLVICCRHAFPVGTAVRFRWENESGAARVEDCFGEADRYVLWLEIDPGSWSAVPLKRSAHRR